MKSNLVPPLRIFSAGSLRHVVRELAGAMPEGAVDVVFGPAGLLRERIARGEACDLYLSANLAHPQTLATSRPGAIVTAFTGNALVAAAQPRLGLTTANFLDTLLRPTTRIGTSTPGADPGGDYAAMLFHKAGMLRSGAEETLVGKARHLVGGAIAPNVPDGRHPIAYFLEADSVDVFFCYRTTAATLGGAFDIVIPPDTLAVEAQYGLLVLAEDTSRRQAADAFTAKLLSVDGQDCLARHGFRSVLHGHRSPGIVTSPT